MHPKLATAIAAVQNRFTSMRTSPRVSSNTRQSNLKCRTRPNQMRAVQDTLGARRCRKANRSPVNIFPTVASTQHADGGNTAPMEPIAGNHHDCGGGSSGGRRPPGAVPCPATLKGACGRVCAHARTKQEQRLARRWQGPAAQLGTSDDRACRYRVEHYGELQSNQSTFRWSGYRLGVGKCINSKVTAHSNAKAVHFLLNAF